MSVANFSAAVLLSTCSSGNSALRLNRCQGVESDEHRIGGREEMSALVICEAVGELGDR
jgi:hypothetical protein